MADDFNIQDTPVHAASGANSDITALSGLTTPLSVAQGGTGAATAIGARTNLGIVTAYKTADTTRSNNDTPTADPDLTFSIGVNEVWEFEFDVVLDDGPGLGMKGGLTFPASPAGAAWDFSYWNDINVVFSGIAPLLAADTSLVFNVDGNAVVFIRVKGVIRNGANAGTVAFNWAQNTSDAGATTVKAGSFVKATKLSQ